MTALVWLCDTLVKAEQMETFREEIYQLPKKALEFKKLTLWNISFIGDELFFEKVRYRNSASQFRGC